MITNTEGYELSTLVNNIRSRITAKMSADDVASVDAQLAQISGRLRNAPADPETSAPTKAEIRASAAQHDPRARDLPANPQAPSLTSREAAARHDQRIHGPFNPDAPLQTEAAREEAEREEVARRARNLQNP